MAHLLMTPVALYPECCCAAAAVGLLCPLCCCGPAGLRDSK